MRARPQIKSLTSLRFFAAAAVLCQHYFGFRFGHLGVSFFYVLSGFVLAYIYDQRLGAPGAKADFFVRRFARIYPAHLAIYVFGLAYFLHAAWLHHQPGWWIVAGALANLFLLHSWVPDENIYFGFAAGSWSLSNEAFFYATFPLWTRLPARGLVAAAAAVAFAIGWALVWFARSPNPEFEHWLFYINPSFRLLEFLTGILCFRYLRWQGHSRLPATAIELAALASLAVAVALCYRLPPALQPLSYSVMFLLPSTAIVWSFAQERGLVSRAIRGKILVELGEASYALYLLHAIAMLYVSHLVARSLPMECAMAVLVVLLSVAMHVWYERPLRRRIIKLYEARPRRRDARAPA